MELPKNPGAIVEHTKSEHWYVRDRLGYWHNGSYSLNDEDFQTHVSTYSAHHKVVSEGTALPVEEPKGLGAVIRNGVLRFVRISTDLNSNYPWRAVHENGNVGMGMNWSEILKDCTRIEILSEGVL